MRWLLGRQFRDGKNADIREDVISCRDEFVNRMIRYPRSIESRVRQLWLRSMGARIRGNCWIRRIQIPRNPWDVEIQEFAALDDGVILLTTGLRALEPRIVIGSGTYINRFTMLDASKRIEIGSRCLIGPFCYLTDHDHGFGGDGPMLAQDLVEAPIKVGNNVWIGAHAIILKGVCIGDNAIIGAGAVVTTNVETGQRVAGVPARQMGMRVEAFDRDPGVG
jgi:maltose O-acetyltransferase